MTTSIVKLNVPSEGIFCTTPITEATYDTETHWLEITEGREYATLDEVLDSLAELFKLNPQYDYRWGCEDRYMLGDRVPYDSSTAAELDEMQRTFDAYKAAKKVGLEVAGITNIVCRHQQQAGFCEGFKECIPR